MSKSSGGGSSSGSESSSFSQRGRSRSMSGSGSSGEMRNDYRQVLRDIRELPDVTYTSSSKHLDAKKALGLENVSDREFAAMFGALPGSTIKVMPPKFETGQWFATISNKAFSKVQRRTIYRDDDSDELVISNDEISIKKDYQRQKLGTISFSKQVYYARKNKVAYIETYAKRGEGINGYYTWSRLGYDRMLTKSERSAAESVTGPVKSVQDIFDKPNGKAYWSANGKSGDMVFDLDKNSRNSKILRKYIKDNLKTSHTQSAKNLSGTKKD